MLKPETEQLLRGLVGNGVDYIDTGKPLPQLKWSSAHIHVRINGCCGIGWKGKPGYEEVFRNGPNTPIEWDERELITVGFVGKAVKRPRIGVGRSFVRLDAGKKDFIYTWRDV